MSQRFKKRPKPKTANKQSEAGLHAKLQYALTLHQHGQLSQAQVLYEQILKVQPRHFDALHLLGVVALQTKNPQRAVQLIGESIALYPNNAACYNNLGLALKELNQLPAALAGYDKAIAIKPDFAEAFNNRGIVLKELKQLDAALASYDQAIAIKPDYAEPYSNRGYALLKLEQFEAAVASCDKAIAIRPDFAEAFNNRGIALKELKQLDAALACYDQAIAIKPDYAEAYSNRGYALLELKRFVAALASCDQAIAIMPDYEEAHYNRGIVLIKLKQLDAALVSCDQAIAIKPDFAEAFNNRGVALKELNQWQAALASYDRAIAIKPDLAEAYSNRGDALLKLEQFDDAVTSYGKAIAIKPDCDFLYGAHLHAKRHVCDWDDAENQLTELIQKIQRNEKASTPFPVFSLTTDLAVQRKAAEIWAKTHHLANFELGSIPRHARGEKLRIGYYSADFYNHATAYLMAELFEQHDKDKFVIIAFYFGPEKNDEFRQRLLTAFDKFIDVQNKSDKEVAQLSRDLGIDIAVDLKGFTQDSRVDIFSCRAAPIQVNYLGYPGTMGADYIDYLIADKTLIPVESQQHYSEKIVYLPDSYQVNDTKRMIADKAFTREELGLPSTGFVFCCFNNNYKITPSTFDGWMRILHRVAGSVLWLYEANAAATSNLCKEAVSRGVEARRLVFAKRLPLPEHLARHRAADLFLDTLPYNAHTTASDALWAGLPVLTCTGEAFASRVAASLLAAIDLPELIVATQEEYEALAVALATNPERLEALRQKLERNRFTTPLFDTKMFTRHLEDAYRQMYERYQAGLPPDHIYVESK